jgi:hypothetical protein
MICIIKNMRGEGSFNFGLLSSAGCIRVTVRNNCSSKLTHVITNLRQKVCAQVARLMAVMVPPAMSTEISQLMYSPNLLWIDLLSPRSQDQRVIEQFVQPWNIHGGFVSNTLERGPTNYQALVFSDTRLAT